MNPIEYKFSDNEGNHLLVALCFCDDSYKSKSLNIPSEYLDIEVVDISITKAYIDKPIHYSVFFKMSTWLLNEFEKLGHAIFTFICSTDELDTNHPNFLPQEFRWELFDKLYQRQAAISNVCIQDVEIGPAGYQSYGRAFYREKHAPIINLIVAYLHEKQQLYC